MNGNQYFEIKDNCRKGLLKYFLKAISVIPKIEKPLILDVGCGSGVPTLALAKYFNGNITAVDSDNKSVIWLVEKVKKSNLSNRITVINNSFLNMNFEKNLFDIIVAEGFLNVIGFEQGFLEIIKYLKTNGYFLIHDEFKNHKKKIEFIESKNCKVIDSFKLDAQIWWDEYYKQLEIAISYLKDKELLKLFKSDLHEIELYKQDSSFFRSCYYVVEK